MPQEPAPTVEPADFTLRDWYAGQFLAGILARPTSQPGTLDQVARVAFEFADAMLAERSRVKAVR